MLSLASESLTIFSAWRTGFCCCCCWIRNIICIWQDNGLYYSLVHTQRYTNNTKIESEFGSASVELSLILRSKMDQWTFNEEQTSWRTWKFPLKFSFEISNSVYEVIPGSHQPQRPLWIKIRGNMIMSWIQDFVCQWVIYYLQCPSSSERFSHFSEGFSDTCFFLPHQSAPEKMNQKSIPAFHMRKLGTQKVIKFPTLTTWNSGFLSGYGNLVKMEMKLPLP